jgi:hypothetical protein
MTHHAAIQSAETMAFLRAVVAGEENLAAKSEDFHARALGATPPTAAAAPFANEHCASASPAEPRGDNGAREEREERDADAVPAAPMLGGLIYEAVMERNSTRALNDALRQTFTGGRVVVSPGVLSLPPQAHAEVLERVRSFTAFDDDNDPYHDFGRFDLAGVTYFFELDCYAREMYASKDAAGAGKASRVLTIMRADEY